jgi:hypothetical protein
VVVVVTERVENGRSASEIRYYICSRQASAQELSKVIRDHWAIENNLHWCLDVVLRMMTAEFARAKAPVTSLASNASFCAFSKTLPGRNRSPKKLSACASDERRSQMIQEFLAI